MHYLKCVMVLAAGSNIVSAIVAKGTAPVSKQNVPASKPNTVATKPIIAATQPNTAATKDIAKPLSQGAIAGAAVGAIKKGITANPLQGSLSPSTPNLNSITKSTPAQDAARAARLEKADEAAEVASEYQRKYQQLNPSRLGNSQPPPPIQFQLGNSYGGNDMSQTSYGGSNYRDGASNNQNTQVDNSMNDNRQQVASGATVSGDFSVKRGGWEGQKKYKRDVRETNDSNEDGSVQYRDFIRLVKVMKRNEDAKNQALYEMAGVPKMRSMVEGLIKRFTDTDGQLTMNNFAALVDAMTDNEKAKNAVISSFNSNLVWAFIIEKILTQYYKPQDQPMSKRDLYTGEFLLKAREAYDDYLWLDSRDILDTRDTFDAFGDEIYSYLAMRADGGIGAMMQMTDA